MEVENEIVFDHDGGPYLRYESTIRVIGPARADMVPDTFEEAARARDAAAQPAGDGSAVDAEAGGGAVVHTEAPATDDHAATDAADGTTADAGGENAEPTIWSTETGYWTVPTERPDYVGEKQHPVEVLLANPDGRLIFLDGMIGNGRADLRSLKVVRSAMGADVTASKRMYGFVHGQLMMVEEIAGFGQPLGNYLSVALDRVED
jgi:hypothetical protein